MVFYTIHPKEVKNIMTEKKAILIDVREREAYRQFHYRNARNLPFEEIDHWIHRIPCNRVLVLYCEYGSTSLLAARRLGKEGYHVYTVIGGIQALKKYEEMADLKG